MSEVKTDFDVRSVSCCIFSIGMWRAFFFNCWVLFFSLLGAAICRQERMGPSAGRNGKLSAQNGKA